MSGWTRLVALSTYLLTATTLAQAGTLHGTVTNKTTGKPAAGVDLVLIQLQGGMQEVARGKSDAQGRFTFDNPGVGAQPMLMRAVYHGVNFNTAVPPGSGEAQVEVFEVSKDPKLITVTGHVVVFQPNGSVLNVGEEYNIQNSAQPPQALFRADGTFEFAIPEKAQLQQVAATGSTGMPVTQASLERGKDHYAIAYAFRPGETNIRLSYELSYAGNAATVKLPAVYADAHLLVVAPPGMQVTGDGLQPAGQEQGMNIYTHAPIAAKASLAVTLSGIPAPIAGTSNESSGQATQEAPQGNSRAESPNVQAIPGRLDQWKWPLLGGFAALFALGAMLLRRTQVVAVVPDAGGATATQQPSPRASAPTANAARSAELAAVDAHVGTSLDALKDAMFRVELRRQAGTISEEEYARERARMEKLLRDLVRG
jgi:hypothetical protein